VYCPGAGDLAKYAVVPQVLNPCETSCGSVTPRSITWSALNFRLSYKILYPQFTALKVLQTYSRSISIAVNISAPGFVYCAAFPSGKFVSAVSEIYASANEPIWIQNPSDPSVGLMTKNITGLIPDSSYDIYCYTDDNQMHVMTIQETRTGGKLSARTTGTKAVFLVDPPPFILPYNPAKPLPEKFFKFRLEALPASPYTTTVRVEIRKADCCDPGCTFAAGVPDPTKVIVSPMAVDFSSVSTTAESQILVRVDPVRVGCFRLNLYTRGRIKYTNATFYFAVKNRVGAPQLQSAVLSDDGSKININFDVPTNRGSHLEPPLTSPYFDCKRLFNLTIVTGKEDCIWSSDSQIVVSPAPAAAALLKIGSPVSLKAQVVTVKTVFEGVDWKDSLLARGNDGFSVAAKVSIEPPETPVAPVISLTTSSMIGKCDDIVLDALRTTGSGIFQWKSIEWSFSVDSNSILTSAVYKKPNENYDALAAANMFV